MTGIRGHGSEVSRQKSGGGFTLGFLLFALCSSAQAQQQPKVAKIGWLAVRPASAAFCD